MRSVLWRIWAVRPLDSRPGWGDAVVLATITVFLYVVARLALGAPQVVRGPDISLSLSALPIYAALSLLRMTAAYGLSILFSIAYGYHAAHNPRAERVLMPLLDVLQSVPILSFLPVVLLGLAAVLPQALAVELASIVLIFTSQVWNLTFAWYQSLRTIPTELREASATFGLTGWLRFKTLELPFAAISLIWNSMMSWAGGWFFLMAAEIFTVGRRDFRLPGLGAYLREAADRGDLTAIVQGLSVLVLLIVLLDQFMWRPLLAWGERFKLEFTQSDSPARSWFYEALRSSRVVASTRRRAVGPAIEQIDAQILHFAKGGRENVMRDVTRSVRPLLVVVVLGGVVYGLVLTAIWLREIPPGDWMAIGRGTGATLLRTTAALAIALAWTLPVGVAIGLSPRLAAVLQPIVQIAASVPATALFPILLLFVIDVPGGMNISSVFLMLLGTQWYLLFNIIAGASALPQDLRDTAAMLLFGRRERWRTLIVPALFPYLVTGAITSTGGAWNASIVAEYTTFGGRTLHTEGLGALIAAATAEGDYPLLLAATLTMVLTVVVINRLVWRPLYRLGEARYRIE